MKGQMFLIIAIIVIVTIILLKNSLNITKILEAKKFLESGVDRLEFENIENELIKTIQISYNQSANMTNNVNDFLKFTRNVLQGRAIDFKGIFVETIHPSVSAGTDTPLNITVFNLLKENMNFLNLTLNTNNLTFSNIGDSGMLSTNFTINTYTSQNYTLTVFYNTSTKNSTETVNIPITIGKSKFIAFFDLRMISLRSENRDKFIQTIVFTS